MSNLITTDTQTQEIDSELIELFEIEMPDGTELYVHSGLDSDLTTIQLKSITAPTSGNYALNTYIAIPMMIDGLDIQADGASSRPSLTVANVGTIFSSQLAGFKNDDLIGKRIRRRRTLRKYLVGESADTGSTVASIEFPRQDYIIDRIAGEDNISITFEVATPFDLEGIKLPRRVVVGKYCSWKYQGHDNGIGGGCTWKLTGGVNFKGSDGNTYTHNAYFDVNDSPLIKSSPLPAGIAAHNTSTAYTETSYVTTGSGSDIRYWLCVIANTNKTPSDSSEFWKETFLWTEWAVGSHALGARVRYLSKTIWKCLVAHTATLGNDIKPSDKSVYWIREDVCGKTIASCKCRYGFVPVAATGSNLAPSGTKNSAARLPFGGFPGTLKF